VVEPIQHLMHTLDKFAANPLKPLKERQIDVKRKEMVRASPLHCVQTLEDPLSSGCVAVQDDLEFIDSQVGVENTIVRFGSLLRVTLGVKLSSPLA
jgi:hypothetical protein